MSIVTNESIAYALDALRTSLTGLVITKAGYETDLTGVTSVTGFSLNYVQTTGTTIRFLFKTSDNANWFKLTTKGKSKTITTETPDFETVNKYGNTISELLALTNIPAFVGKKILLAVALESTDIENAIPKVKIAIKTMTDTQVLKKVELSPEYSTGSSGQIDKITYDSETSGDGEVKLYAQLRDESGKLSAWQEAKKISGDKCMNVQLKAEYSVSAVNSGTAKLNTARIFYKDGTSIVVGNASGEIISWTQDWYMNVRHCRMTVKHSPLVNASIKSYVCFREKPQEVKREQLGIGTGKKVTYQLGHVDGIRYDSVKLYYDNELIAGDYDVNTEVGRITCTAPSGKIVTCDYEYGWGFEVWQKMSASREVSEDEYDLTEYRYTRPDEDETEKSVCAVKIVMKTDTGTATQEAIGKGTGKSRTYLLSHRVSDGIIKIYSNGSAISEKNYALMNDTHYVNISATKGAALTASYNWAGDTPVIHQFTAVFSE